MRPPHATTQPTDPPAGVQPCGEFFAGAPHDHSPSETGELDNGMEDPALPLPITQLLEPGEIVVLLLKPSPWYILLEAMPMLLGIGLVAAILVVMGTHGDMGLGPYRRDIIIAAVGLGGMRLFWQLLDWLYTVYLLTDRRLVKIRGVLRLRQYERPIEEVVSAELIATFRERALGLSSLTFTLEPEDRHYVHAWRSVARPTEVHRIIMDTLRRYRRKQ